MRPERKPPPLPSAIPANGKKPALIADATKGPTTATIFEGEPLALTVADCNVAHSNPSASPPFPTSLDATMEPYSHSSNNPPVTRILPCHLDFIETIKESIFNQDSRRACDKPLFEFKFTKEAAETNEHVLAAFNFKLSAAILAQRNSPVYYGSEFQPVDTLRKLLQKHPLWPFVECYLLNGITFPLLPIPDDLRRIDCEFMLERGNHKSAKTPEGLAIIREHMQADIEHGFALPLPVSCLKHFITEASIAPLGVQDQSSLTDEGIRIAKWRMTHDQTFPAPSALSVNKRVITENLPACKYGHALLRILHFIVDLRRRHPDKRILLGKFDLKAAFRRAHLSPETALESMSVLDDILMVSLRLTFGGAPCPPTWSCLSESICDLANDLMACPAWNHLEVRSPIQDSILPPLRLPDTVQIGQAVQLAVKFPSDETGKSDIFLDDFIPVALDIGDNAERVACAVPLAIHAAGRQLSPNEPLPRDDLISKSKLAAEGRMEETKVVLGWLLNTRELLIHLPLNKFLGWTKDILATISQSVVKGKELETIVGRLNHVAMAMTQMRHFLNRLRHLTYVALSCKWGKARLTENVREDLILCLKFLRYAKEGVSMNLLVFAEPTHYYRSDACEHGLGGYSILSGKAWRFEIPVNCRGRTTINVLEFIGSVVTVWIDMLAGDVHPDACLLSQTDSTSAAGWLRKSCFDEKQHKLAMQTARHLATLLINSKTCLFSQWVEGEANGVSDILSRDHHLTDSEVVALILTSCPEQVPNGLHLHPLPKEIVSWLTSKLQEQPETMQLPKEPTRSKYAAGSAGLNTSAQLASGMTSSLTSSAEAKSTESLVPSLKPSEPVDSAPNGLTFLKRHNVEPPWTMWLRPSGLTTGLIPDTTTTADWRMFYSAN